MEQRDKFIESETGDENRLEKLMYEDMDLLYENFPSDNSKHSLNDYFISLGSFLKFLSADIDYSTNLIDNLLIHIKDNKSSDNIAILLNAVNEENNTIKNFVLALSGFFENDGNPELENVNFNNLIDDILVRIAGYTESKKISIFKKLGDDVNVKVNKEQFYLACFHIIKSFCENINENGKIFITSRENNNKIEIEFRDNVSGIPDEILKYIFEPVNPLKHNWEFGLVLANKIIKDHFGKISVNRTEELNTLIVTLPIIFENDFNNLINERLI
ncbi:MAG: HAMP domain-containing sensor histidine kinase [Ignavibacteriaceae bacterium]